MIFVIVVFLIIFGYYSGLFKSHAPAGTKFNKDELQSLAYHETNPNFIEFSIWATIGRNGYKRIVSLRNINAQGAYTYFLRTQRTHKNAVAYGVIDKTPWTPETNTNPESWDSPLGVQLTKKQLRMHAFEGKSFSIFQVISNSDYGPDKNGNEIYRKYEMKKYYNISASEAYDIAEECKNKSREIIYMFFGVFNVR